MSPNTWNDVLKEVEATRKDPQSPPDLDAVRRGKMKAVMGHTRRPLIVYAVDFLNEAKARATENTVSQPFVSPIPAGSL